MLDVYPSRERAEDFPGVTGRLVAEAAADAARGRPVAWAPGFDDAERVLGLWLRPSDVCLVLGAGDVDELGGGSSACATERNPCNERLSAR